MIFKYRSGIHNSHGDNGNICFLCDLETALVEGKEGIRGLVAGALREDADGNPVFGFLNGLQNGFQSCLDVLAIQKETVKIFHPDVKQGPF